LLFLNLTLTETLKPWYDNKSYRYFFSTVKYTTSQRRFVSAYTSGIAPISLLALPQMYFPMCGHMLIHWCANFQWWIVKTFFSETETQVSSHDKSQDISD